MLYVGTDDGALWVTRNGGKDWTNVTKKVGLDRALLRRHHRDFAIREGAGLRRLRRPPLRHRRPLRVRHRGLREDLEAAQRRTSRRFEALPREDVSNPNLLYLGTEFAIWATLDRGGPG